MTGLIRFTSDALNRPRRYARLSQCFVSFSEPRAIFTKRRLSWKLPLPVPSAMLAPTLSAAQTICPVTTRNRLILSRPSSCESQSIQSGPAGGWAAFRPVFGELCPAGDDLPHFIRKFLRQFVNLKVLKAGSQQHGTPTEQRATDNGLLTTDTRRSPDRRITRPPDHFSLAPFGTSSPKVTSTGRPGFADRSGDDHPLDSTPRNLRGWRFVTITTFMPINFSGA